MTPDQSLFERLCDLRDAQAPVVPNGARHPSRSRPYFRALADAFEAGHLFPIRESVFDNKEPET